MNKELENELKEIFFTWRENMQINEDHFLQGKISYVQYVQVMNDLMNDKALAMFNAIHSMANW